LNTSNHLMLSPGALVAMLVFSPMVFAQSAGQTPAAKSQGAKSAAPNSNTEAQVDLSGIWTIGGAFSLSPKGGTMDAGTPADGVP
jgi:hypothetical protein